ncbi:hypothetical protein TWF102_009542 [Orbilia oligospora]|uniref:Uncharacterized protein n=1 Tax=Orbilia oligospora TaxID=2813651 RepID=A0A7C8NJU3_ORBOL|nr:hypothetical protein TWF102_009542 [Orbilia oligospora]KAF3102477.1 hypothetical protein TWF103_007650 [Orbilia oligospora]
MVASVGAVNPIQEWSIEYKSYWFDTIKLLKSPISGILRIMDDYYIDTEYCPISEEEDVLGTGESLERYGIILQRILPMFNETLPDISQNGSEIDLKIWKEVGETISAYRQQKFVDAVEEIWVKFELHLNIIDSLADWDEKLGLSDFNGLKLLFSELDGLEKFEKTLSCKKTLNRWEKLTPSPFGDCKCNEEAELIEVKTCVASCVLTGGYKPCDPQKDDIPPKAHSRNELREAVRDYKDDKIRATDLIKTFLGRLGR